MKNKHIPNIFRIFNIGSIYTYKAFDRFRFVLFPFVPCVVLRSRREYLKMKKSGLN